MKLHHLALLASLASSSPTTDNKKHHEEEIHPQWAICDPSPSSVLAKLGHHPREPAYKSHPVTYYDSSPPRHTARGVAFRTKVKKLHHVNRDVSLVKVRFPGADHPSEEELEGADECVWDRYGDDEYYTCSQLSILDGEGEGTTRGGSPWSAEQVEFAGRFHDNITWSDLAAYGPFENPKWKVRVGAGSRGWWGMKKKGIKAKFDSVIAVVDDGKGGTETHHLMEIEAQIPKKGSREAYDEITADLKRRGVVLCEPQDTKTLRLFKAMGLMGEEEAGEELEL